MPTRSTSPASCSEIVGDSTLQDSSGASRILARTVSATLRWLRANRPRRAVRSSCESDATGWGEPMSAVRGVGEMQFLSDSDGITQVAQMRSIASCYQIGPEFPALSGRKFGYWHRNSRWFVRDSILPVMVIRTIEPANIPHHSRVLDRSNGMIPATMEAGMPWRGVRSVFGVDQPGEKSASGYGGHLRAG